MNILIESAETEEALKVRKKLEILLEGSSIKITTNYEDKNIICIIVIGGDGQMLRSMHKLHNLNIPFFGINAGSVGFLMNEQDTINLVLETDNLPKISLYPLHIIARDVDGLEHNKIAFNDATFIRSTSQAAKLEITVNNILQMQELIADGVIISTPAGSSAYNFSAGGRIIPLETKLMCVTPICPFRPRRWQGAMIPDSSSIKIRSLENKKRPVNIIADFLDVPNILSVEITQHKEIKTDILFASYETLDTKMIKEQFII
ncbi:MAG: NAD kinase [Rickettsiaceae bacterium]|nr:NAD kinase [Rickettsiaceae bacterium]